MDSMQIVSFLESVIRLSIPLMLAALGLVVSERSGSMNIGVEGIMLMAAFSAYTGAKLTGSFWFGVLMAIIVAILLIIIFAVATITCRAEQVIVGAGLNVLCAGLSSFLYRLIFHGTGRLDGGIAVETFPDIAIPGLSEIPVIGPVLFNHNILVYFAFLMIPVIWILMKKTSLGLKIISVGEYPQAADSLGISVRKIRYGALIFSAAMIGIAGAFLCVAQTSSFGENMTNGRGFIAMAIVILGKWNPVGVLFGALIFGGASALQMFFQTSNDGVPTNIIMMIPYVITVIAVILVSRKKVGQPKALGVPYTKE